MLQKEHSALLVFMGNVIHNYRRASGASQKDVAKALGCTYATVARWEKGQHAMPMKLWPHFLAFIGRDPAEPYPAAQAAKGDVASAERLVTGTLVEPQIVSELKSLRDNLRETIPALVRETTRESMRELNTVLPALVREAVREALRDSQSAIGELRDIKAQMAPALAEMKLVKDQVIVAVKEAMAEHKPQRHESGRSEHRKEWKEKALREEVAFDSSNPEVREALSPIFTLPDGTKADASAYADAVFGDVQATGVTVGEDLDAYPVNKAATYAGFKAGLTAVMNGGPCDDTARAGFVARTVAELQRLGFRYANSKGTTALLDVGFKGGVAAKAKAEQDEAERVKKVAEAVEAEIKRKALSAKRKAELEEKWHWLAYTVDRIETEIKKKGYERYLHFTVIRRHLEELLSDGIYKGKELDHEFLIGAAEMARKHAFNECYKHERLDQEMGEEIEKEKAARGGGRSDEDDDDDDTLAMI